MLIWLTAMQYQISNIHLVTEMCKVMISCWTLSRNENVQPIIISAAQYLCENLTVYAFYNFILQVLKSLEEFANFIL